MDLNKKRCGFGNGHRMWLRNDSPPWVFVRDIGEAWEKVVKDPSSPALMEAARKWERLTLTTNLECCDDLRVHFGDYIDSLELKMEGAWFWLANYVLAFRVAKSYLTGGEPLVKSDLADLKAAGAVNASCFYANYNVWKYGGQTFSFALPLAAKLMLTDIGHIRWSELKLPFPAFVIQLPPELATLVDPSTGLHRLDSILVVDGHANGRRRVELLFTGQENENSSRMGDDANVYANLWCNEESHLVADAIKFSQAEDTDRKFALFAGKEGDEATKMLMSWAVAMVVYLTDFPEDRAQVRPVAEKELEEKISSMQGKARRNAKSRLRAMKREPLPFQVGTHVTLDPRLAKLAAQIGSGVFVPPSVASYVRGHRKMQPYGPGRAQRRPIWVDPYWRNLEAGPHSSKTYDVK